jgi:hypothetical protein
MIIQQHTPNGIIEHELTLTELKEEAKKGNKQAIREIIALKGGWSNLTQTQKEKVIQLIINENVEL